MGYFNCVFENNSLMGLFGQNMKKLKILKLSRDSRYLQKLALKFVNKHNILYLSQYGFRSRHSTQHATLEILNDILSNFDKTNSLFVYLLT